MKAINTTLGRATKVAMATAVLVATATAGASAHDYRGVGPHHHGERGWQERGGHPRHAQPQPRRGQRPNNTARTRGNDDGAIAAAAIIGLIGAAIVTSTINNRTDPLATGTVRPTPQPHNPYPPAPQGHGQNHPVAQTSSSLEPWTPQWYSWCTQKYRSFNAETGTFRGYDGRNHFCVPK